MKFCLKPFSLQETTMVQLEYARGEKWGTGIITDALDHCNNKGFARWISQMVSGTILFPVE